jgi:predicted DNA-binding transcriptional regulator AlpA
MPPKASQIELSQQALELKHRNASKKPVVPTGSSAPAAALSKGVAVLRRHQVLQKLGIANTTLYDWIMRGLIPLPLDIGPGTQVKLWLESDIDQVLLRLARERDERLAKVE